MVRGPPQEPLPHPEFDALAREFVDKARARGWVLWHDSFNEEGKLVVTIECTGREKVRRPHK